MLLFKLSLSVTMAFLMSYQSGFSQNNPDLTHTPAQPDPVSKNNTQLSSALSAFHAENYEQAYQIALPLAEQKNTKAQILIAWLYEKGRSVKQDDQQAVFWYKAAAWEKSAEAYIALARLAIDKRGGLVPKQVKDYLTKAAALNNNQARLILSELYAEGQSVKQSAQLSAYWLSQAASQGDPNAQYQLAQFYLNGYGVKQNPLKAIHWYEKAADQNVVEAIYALALLYAEGYKAHKNTLEKDPQKALYFFKTAAEKNHAAAMADLGLIYYQGNTLNQDLDLAANWFKKSATLNDPEGCYLYAFILARGEGVEQDFDQAYYWLLKAGKSESEAYNIDREKLKTLLEKTLHKERQVQIQTQISQNKPFPKQHNKADSPSLLLGR